MKKWMVLFVMFIYLYIPLSTLELHPVFGLIDISLIIVFGCFNVVNAIKMQRNPSFEIGLTMKAIMFLKLCLLPVYVFCFMLLLASVGMLLSVWFTIVGIFMMPMVIMFSCFILFSSSSLAISRIIVLGRRGVLSVWQCVIHVIFQLLFVADVVDSIIVYGNERNSKC